MKYRTSSSFLRFSATVSIAATCLLVGFVSASGVGAATPAPTWSALKTLATSGSASAHSDPLGGSLLYATNSGYPSITPVAADGSLGRSVVVPNDGPTCGSYGTPGPVAMISNGNAIVTWYSIGEFATYSCMAEYFVNGTFGPATFVSDGIGTLSAQPDEVLTSAGGTVLDWTIDSKGTIAAKGSPVNLVPDPVAGSAGIALDPDGSAVMAAIVYLDDYSYSEIWTATRSASGTWATAAEMAASNDDAVGIQMAAAPDGRAIVAWQDWSTNGSSDTTYAAVRQPDKAFTSATAINSLTSAYLTDAYTSVAAGADGTLAVAAIGITYTDSYSFTTSSSVDLVAPADSALGAPTGLASFSGHLDQTESAVGSTGFVVAGYASGLALGAGDDAVLVGGIVQTQTAPDPADPGSGGRIVDQTVLALRVTNGGTVSHPLSQLSATYPWSGGPNPPSTNFSGASIDKQGNGVLAGQLDTANGDLDFETQSVPVPLSVSTAALPQATTGKAYSAKVSASGGATPYKWSRVGGAKPPGLSFSTAGAWSGTPTTAGSYKFTVEVTDSDGGTATKALAIVVETPVSITTATLPSATVRKAYSAAIKATGGAVPYKWSRSSGAKPPGLSFSTAGAWSGTPTTAGSYKFTVEVADSDGRTATKALTIVVKAS
jgi:hypothetical protein